MSEYNLVSNDLVSNNPIFKVSDDIFLCILEKLDFCDATNFRVVLTMFLGYNLKLTKRELDFLTCLVSYRDCAKNGHFECLQRYHRVNSNNMWKFESIGVILDSDTQVYLYENGFLERINKDIYVRKAILDNDLTKLQNLDSCSDRVLPNINKNTKIETVTELVRLTQADNVIKIALVKYFVLKNKLLVAAKICQIYKIPRITLSRILINNCIFPRKYIKYEELAELSLESITTQKYLKITREDLSFLEESRGKCLEKSINCYSLSKSINLLRVRYSLPIENCIDDDDIKITAFYNNNLKFIYTLDNNFDLEIFFYSFLGGALDIISYYTTKGTKDQLLYVLNETIDEKSLDGEKYFVSPGIVEVVKFFNGNISAQIYDIIENYDFDVISPLLKLVVPRVLLEDNIKKLVKNDLFDEYISRSRINLDRGSIFKLAEYTQYYNIIFNPNKFEICFEKHFDDSNYNYIIAYFEVNSNSKRGYYFFKKYKSTFSDNYVDILLNCKETPNYVFLEYGIDISLRDTINKNNISTKQA